MTKLSDQETADRLSGSRPGMLIVMVLFFLLQQAAYFSQPPTVTRVVDYVRLAGWIALATVLLAILMRGGFWFKSAAVRALMEDEVTRAHRARAVETGFVATMIAAICLYVLNLFEPVTGREAIHILLSIGLGFAALHFAALEWRALKDG